MDKVANDDMKMILKSCGFDILMQLLCYCNGITLDIPKTIKKNDDILMIETLCGEETATALLKYFSGKKIHVPNLRNNHIGIMIS